MKLWIDDVRPAPESYEWLKSVDEAKSFIQFIEFRNKRYAIHTSEGVNDIELIDIDHDAGDYESEGGHYIKLLDWLEETGRNYPIHIHSMNPVGVENMKRIIRRNNWREV